MNIRNWRLQSSVAMHLMLAGWVCVAGFASRDSLAQTAAQGLRDPTMPPAAFGAAQTGAPNPIDSFRPEHIVVVDGKRYLVSNGRRYSVGETFQGARIERISESEIWFKSGSGIRKVPLFSGIEKKTPRPAAANQSSSRKDGMKGQEK
jgi:hypothetical protein